jgi:hypothetical protein
MTPNTKPAPVVKKEHHYRRHQQDEVDSGHHPLRVYPLQQCDQLLVKIEIDEHGENQADKHNARRNPKQRSFHACCGE